MLNYWCVLNRRIVPKSFKFYILLLRYESPMMGRGPSEATRLSKHKNSVSCKKSFSADGIQTKDLNMVGV